MALRILSSPSEPADLAADLTRSIAAALPGASVEVTPCSPGHFEIRVVSASFAGKNRVQQQQLVYAAIAPLMRGDAAPVHAIDRLQTETP
ncbi:MAG: BolA family transcriptional regulator [Myxococcales bacterium]|nr:BolA family transcriptional regulator [Myxococcales bacterium]MDH5306304.1 BolA family transcriptional regulator [Myxococcales bacterium]MDH5565080.1 BolA family transcriptional regulator [Myxococcales bacterium]